MWLQDWVWGLWLGFRDAGFGVLGLSGGFRVSTCEHDPFHHNLRDSLAIFSKYLLGVIQAAPTPELLQERPFERKHHEVIL